MPETVEIRSVLKLDDQSSAVVEKMKHGYEGLSEKVGEVEHEMMSMVRQSLAVAAGFEIGHGIESIKELGAEVFNAAKNLGEETKGLTGAIAMGDRAGRSYEDIKAQAGALHEELEGLAVSAGASTESIVDAFTTIQSRSQRSVEATKELTEQMIYASRAVPGGMEGMAGAFRDLEAGIVRPRNQLVQLTVMTGTVEGSAKKVAKGLNEMFQHGQADKVAELAEQAVSRMAEKMKNQPATFQQVVQSLKDMREQLFEAAGVPILKALTEPLSRLRKYFQENRESVEHWAKSVGEKVGSWIKEAANKIQQGFQYLQNHAEEIKAAITEAVGAAKAVVSWIIEHRELIAMAFGAKMAAPVVGGAVGMAKGAFGVVQGIAAGGAPSLGMAGGGAVAFAATVAAFAAAVGAWAVATDQWGKLMAETGGGKSEKRMDEEARKERIQQMAGSTGAIDTKAFDQLRQKFVEQADAMGMTSRAAGEYADSLWAQHRALRQQTEGLDEIVGMISSGKDFEAANQWVVIYDKAVQTHNEAVMKYAANVIAGNETLQNAFLAAGSNVEGGFDQLATLLDEKTDFGKIVKDMAKNAEKGKMPDKVNVNFNGNSFNIKQEFREGDPDRIALVFKRELVRSAVYRQQSRVSTPFGL